MTATIGQPALSESHYIGLLGDTHGDVHHLLTVSDTLWSRGVGVLLVLGDFGFIWPGDTVSVDLDVISVQLSARGQTLFFVDGNHEDFATLETFPIGDDGLRWLRQNIAHIPRGYRTVLQSGATLAALGGANSIDRFQRSAGRTWWPAESITDADLTALGNQRVDILVGHDAPTPLPSLDAILADTDHHWPEDMLAYSRSGRRQFHRGLTQVRPQLYLGGHYHLPIDETVNYGEGDDTFRTRVILLSHNGSPQTSQAILNVHTRDVQVFRRDDTRVTELIGVETGRWKVTTERSHYIFDFDASTVIRHPGKSASTSINDTTRPLRAIDRCRVGESGAWTMRPDGGYADPIDFYWQVSTEIRRIERTTDRDD